MKFDSIIFIFPCFDRSNPYVPIGNLTIFSFEFRIKLFFPSQIIKGFVEKFSDHESDFLPYTLSHFPHTHTLARETLHKYLPF